MAERETIRLDLTPTEAWATYGALDALIRSANADGRSIPVLEEVAGKLTLLLLPGANAHDRKN